MRGALGAFVAGWIAVFGCSTVCVSTEAKFSAVFSPIDIVVSDDANQPRGDGISVLCGNKEVVFMVQPRHVQRDIRLWYGRKREFTGKYLPSIPRSYSKNTIILPFTKCVTCPDMKNISISIARKVQQESQGLLVFWKVFDNPIFTAWIIRARTHECICKDRLDDCRCRSVIYDPKLHPEFTLPFSPPVQAMGHKFNKDIWPPEGHNGDFASITHNASLPVVNPPLQNADTNEQSIEQRLPPIEWAHFVQPTKTKRQPPGILLLPAVALIWALMWVSVHWWDQRGWWRFCAWTSLGLALTAPLLMQMAWNIWGD